jgi:hypothetical protein
MQKYNLYLMTTLLTIVAVAMILTACGGSSAPEEVAVAETEVPAVAETTATPVPTDTPAPTDTPVSTATPTHTPIPTDTPTSTSTPTDTPTPTVTSTPTDTPTPTPTPIPFDLTVMVNGEDGAPLPGISISLAGIGSQTTDPAGQASWANLPGDTVSLTAATQGYFPTQESITLERGLNEVTVVLQRDPAALLPAEACAPGETLLYLEDFQDGQAQGWINIDNAPWSLGPAPDNPGNTVLTISGPLTGNLPVLLDHVFENAVWRIRARYDGNVATLFNWRHSWDQGDKRYLLYVNPNLTEFVPLDSIGEEVPGAQSPQHAQPSTWHRYEIRTVGNTSAVAMDGQEIMSFVDPNPLPPGTIGLHPIYEEGMAGSFHYDNISVCGLP